EGASEGDAGGRKGLLVVRLRPEQEPAVLRRQPQDHRLHAPEIHDGEGGRLLALRLQALGQEAALRRHAQDPGMIDRKIALLAPFALALSLGACGWFGGSSSSSTDASNVYCPAPLTVADAQRLTRFKDG